MADINVFEDEAFSVSSLTAAINEAPEVPGRLAALGLFEEEGSTTITQQIEKDGDTLHLVPAADRGAPGLVVTGSKRVLIPFNNVHLPQTFTILADEIQGIRAFGEQTELQAVQDVVNKRLGKMRRQLDATHEHQRMGAVLGTILDADGSTVLLDLYDRFGISAQVVQMELGSATTKVRLKVGEALDAQEDALGNIPSSGSRALCGKNFWNALITHKSVEETYLNTMQASQLRGDAREEFEFGGVIWERYRGKVGGRSFIPDDEARLVPIGVPELFLSIFAPANYMETVNTLGLPYYAKQEVMPFNKGVAGEAQSNPLHICTRPRAVIKLVK
ncbi:major capsid protein [Pseudomonas aeruginosa]|uniref:major capsid protein n=1 Tax=Pseudomonas aeruginosa TaxID=287 RepID=UPI0012DAF11A|nr:major capsid protein [Pseudomonas aeruginosa]MBH4087772.1 major capsid protein [Pseudomonas aeruginosa]MBX5586334.1 major capsid protein [Pseudomonas aeruginosa]MBX5627379.1 major capsid protein [Pseudomonas aeruginosa]MBX5633323.1 major capsid protein [Pseudomonas aeruginosa]MBX5676093.1 major capsid protein [Pseudomonas aeruginosa]